MALEHRQTLGQVVDRTLALCGDFRGARLDGEWWDRAQVRLVLSRLHLEVVNDAGVLKGSAVIPLEEDARVYNLPHDCVRLRKVMLHGVTGTILLPFTQSAVELVGGNLKNAGESYWYYRDMLAHDQIGVIPTPDASGSSATSSSSYGIARSIQDADGNSITYDAEKPGRFIHGVPFTRVGGTGILRSAISPEGNLFVTYDRAPSMWSAEDEYPDNGIPTFFHQAFRFGAAKELLGTSRNAASLSKAKLFSGLWRRWLSRLSVYSPATRTHGLQPL